MTVPQEERLHGWRARWPEWVAVGYLVAVVLALVVTLRALDGDDFDDFDDLNNLFQLPLALPWSITPRGTDHVQNAYIDAGFGVLNAALLYLLLRRVRRRSATGSAIEG